MNGNEGRSGYVLPKTSKILVPGCVSKSKVHPQTDPLHAAFAASGSF